MLRFVPPFRGRHIASTRGGVTENFARISVSMLAACAGTVAHEGSATVSTSIAVSASGQQTDQQHFGTATVGVVISSTASASVTSTHNGTATASIVITTTAAGETGATHAGTASIGVTISATASGTASQTHTGVASCQVNLSVSAAGINANTTVPDETSNGNNMVLVGASPSFTSDSAIGTRATEFDRNYSLSNHPDSQAGRIDDTFENVFDSPFSVSMWIKPSDGQPQSLNILFDTYSGHASGVVDYQFMLKLEADGKIHCIFRKYTGSAALSNNCETVASAFTNGSQSSYKHIVLTVDSSAIPTIYVNGTANNTNSTDGGGWSDLSNYVSTNDCIGVGARYTNSTSNAFNSFEGKMDDVSLWSKELSSTEVSNLYNSGNGSSLTGSSDLEGWWKMGEHSVVPITHSGTATVSVGVTASASGDLLELHSGTASCQVNLSASASGTVVAPFTNSYSISLDNANDSIELSSDVSVGNSWTYSVWLKPDTFSGSSLFGYLAAENNDGGAGGTATRHGLGLVQSGTTNGGSGMVYYYSQTGTGSDQLSSTALTANVWNHVVVTADVTDNEMKIYLNGSLDNTITKSNIQTVFDSLGRYSNLWYYGGKMDEIAFWDSILSASDILAIYNDGEPINLAANSGNYTSSSDLIAYYRFDENSGTSIADSSSNSNTATLTNGPTFSSDVPVYKNENSIALDGSNDYAPVVGSLSGGDYNFLTSTLTYSASLWLRLDDHTQDSSQVLLANNYTSSNKGIQIWYDNRSGISTKALRVNSWAGSSVSTNTASAITDNNWHHVLVTSSGASGTLTVYLDGSSLATASLGSVSATAPNQDLAIGGRVISGSVNSPIDGKLDEVAIWDVALSSADATAIYNSGTPNNLKVSGSYDTDRSGDLQGYWRFEENTGTSIADTSGNGNTATLTNGPTFNTDVPVAYTNNYSIELDSTDDYCDIGTGMRSTFDGATASTVSLWFKTDSTLPTGTNIEVLLQQESTAAGNNFLLAMRLKGSIAQFYFKNSAGSYALAESSTLSANTWYHVVGVFDGSSTTSTLYINGSSVDTNTSAGSALATSAANSDCIIGATALPSRYFGGHVDETAVWDVALSSADVTAIYNSGTPNDLTASGSYDTDRSGDLQGYWRFEENTGTSIADSSGNSRTATLTNGPTFSTTTPS